MNSVSQLESLAEAKDYTQIAHSLGVSCGYFMRKLPFELTQTRLGNERAFRILQKLLYYTDCRCLDKTFSSRARSYPDSARARLRHLVGPVSDFTCAAKLTVRPHSFLQDPTKPISPTLVSQGCLVVDVLGDDVRWAPLIALTTSGTLTNVIIFDGQPPIHRSVLLYGDERLPENIQAVRRGTLFLSEHYSQTLTKWSIQAGQLDNLSRRFSWFRKQLASSDEEYGQVFPPGWKVGQHLVGRFAEITRFVERLM